MKVLDQSRKKLKGGSFRPTIDEALKEESPKRFKKKV